MKSRQQTLNELWEKIPIWAKHRYHSDALTNHIIQRCVDRGDSPETVGWEIARVLTGEIEAMRNKLQDIAEKSSHVFNIPTLWRDKCRDNMKEQYLFKEGFIIKPRILR